MKKILCKAMAMLLVFIMMTTLVFAEETAVAYKDISASGETVVSVKNLADADRVLANGTTIGLGSSNGYYLVSFNGGNILNFRVNVLEKAAYDISLDVACNITDAKEYTVSIDGGAEYKVKAAGGEGMYTPVSNLVLSPLLDVGNHVITIKNVNASVHFMGIRLNRLDVNSELLITDVRRAHSGFYSNGINNNSNSVDSAIAGGALLRQGGEWIQYDVSSLPAGTYEVILGLQQPSTYLTTARFYLDGVLSLVSNFGKIGTGSWSSTHVDTLMGTVYIPEGTQNLKIENTSTTPAFQIGKVYLRRISGEDFLPKVIRIRGTNITHRTDYNSDPSYTTDTSLKKPSATTIEEEIDYHIQSDSYAFTSNFSIGENAYAILRASDWARYDIKGMGPGTYKVKFYTGTKSDTKIEFRIGAKVPLEATLKGNGVDYSMRNAEVGLLYIPENAEYLRLDVLNNATFLTHMDFEFVSPDDTTNVYKKTINYNQYNNYSAISAYSQLHTGVGIDGYKTHLAPTHTDYGAAWIYDASPTTTNICRESAVIYNANNEWAKWDISVVPAGVYNLTVNRKSSEITKFNMQLILLDAESNVIDTTDLIWGPTGTGTAYTKITSVDKGIKIPAEAKYLVLKRIKSTSSAIYITSFEFEGAFVTDTKFTSDSEGENVINAIEADGTVYANIEMQNSTPSKNVTVIVAVYEGEELVGATAYKNILVEKSTEVLKSYSANVKKGQTVKVFVWDNLENISPMDSVTVLR